MDEHIIALTSKGKIEVLRPIAAATLRDFARALVEMADSIMIPPNVNPPGPPEERQDE